MTLFENYKKNIVPQLMEKRGYTNINQVPKITKVTINTGISRDKDREVFKEATDMIAAITGQKPVTTKSRKSISNFKLRDGDPVGVKVTLHGEKMYDFLNRLINISLPRVRDFRGISLKSFDGSGNYSMGITDQSIFTEVNVDKVKHTIGMDITVVTSAETDDEARDLLTFIGMPFAK
jgi:large subunit ribosomal protein L5